MIWKLDDIDFKDYGVRVSKSSGVLDLPELVDDSTDWLDLNGKDYWQDLSDLKYKDQEILLYCWLKATSYEDFNTKTTAFFSTLTGPGKRDLLTPFGNTIEVSLQDAVPVTRVTSYLQGLQIGVFTLRLTVSGDSQTKLITIYAGAEPRLVAAYGTDAKHISALQGEDAISFNVEFNTKQNLGRGLHVVYDNKKYIHLEYPKIKHVADNKVVYELKFENQFFYLKDIAFFVLGAAKTQYFGNMSDILDRIIDCMNVAYPGLFIKGIVEDTPNKLHEINLEKCYDVLIRIVEEYEMQYEYSQDPVTYAVTIGIKKSIGNATALAFEYGKDNEAYSIDRIPTPREKLCTKLFCYGSPDNLPLGYPYQVLTLETPIERYFYGMQIERHKEYSTIKPEHTCTVTSYVKTTKASTWVYAPGTYPGPRPIRIYTDYPEDNTYKIIDSSMPFDLFEKDEDGNHVYLIGGKTAKIRFNSGDLAGLGDFEVTAYDHYTKEFTITPITFNGEKYPTSILYPRAGDAFVIIDINLPQIYVDDALTRLHDAGYSSMFDGVDFNPPNADYEVQLKPNYTDAVKIGDMVQLTNTTFEIDAQIRVIRIEKDMYSNIRRLTLSPNVVKTKRQNLELRVSSIERSVKAVKFDDPAQTQASGQTTRDLRNTIIDPIDDKLKTDRIIRRRSLDPVHLAEDAKTLQYSLKGALVTANVGDNPNEISIESGVFLNHSFYAVDRETIKTIKAL